MYKRQARATVDGESVLAVGLSVGSDGLVVLDTATTVTVSYTHLDVYKRQDEGMFTGNQGVCRDQQTGPRSRRAGEITQGPSVGVRSDGGGDGVDDVVEDRLGHGRACLLNTSRCV